MKRRTIVGTVVMALAVAVSAYVMTSTPDANAAASGLFKITCGLSHTNSDDPIVYPGRPGAAHLHDFFGNAGTNAGSTYNSMLGVRSTCPQKDTAGYWIPALYQNGRKVQPEFLRTYYMNSISPGEERIEAFPPDFRMIAGNAKNTTPAGVNRIEWACTDNTAFGKEPPTRCASGGIQVRITFPSCWNGVTAPNGGDSAPNMRFPSGGKCPASHPRAFPTLRSNANYNTGVSTGSITLSSGNVYSAHADFWNTWDQAALQALVVKCFRGKQDCGHFKGTTPGRNP